MVVTARFVYKRMRGPLAAMLAGVVVATGCAAASGSGKIVDTETVETTTSARKVSADGVLEALETVPVAPEISGVVSEVYAKDGETVSAGDTLFTIDTASLSEQLSAVESGGGGGSGSGTSDIEAPDLDTTFTAMNELVDAQKALIDAQIAAINSDPARTVIEKTIDVAAKETEKLQLDLANLRYQTEVTTNIQGDVANAQGFAAFGDALAGSGSSATADAQAAELRRQIDAATVKAPIGGVVTLSSLNGGSIGAGPLTAAVSSPGTIRSGSIVTAGQTVMTIYDTAEPRVDAEIDEDSVPLVAAGQRAEVVVDAFSGQTLTGQVLSVALNPSVSETGEITYASEIRIPNELSNWRPGMTATVDIAVESGAKGVELPASAVVSRDGKDYVFVVEGGKATEREVQEQPGRSGFVIVTDGLRVGDEVVTSGARDLEDGESVRSAR